MAAATVSSEVILGGAPLAAGARLNLINITMPSGNAQTSVTVSHGSIAPGSVFLFSTPTNTTGADIGQVVGTISTSGSGTTATATLTLTFAAADLDGTSTLLLGILSQP
jgi:hypothetical protein